MVEVAGLSIRVALRVLLEVVKVTGRKTSSKGKEKSHILSVEFIMKDLRVVWGLGRPPYYWPVLRVRNLEPSQIPLYRGGLK